MANPPSTSIVTSLAALMMVMLHCGFVVCSFSDASNGPRSDWAYQLPQNAEVEATSINVPLFSSMVRNRTTVTNGTEDQAADVHAFSVSVDRQKSNSTTEPEAEMSPMVEPAEDTDEDSSQESESSEKGVIIHYSPVYGPPAPDSDQVQHHNIPEQDGQGMMRGSMVEYGNRRSAGGNMTPNATAEATSVAPRAPANNTKIGVQHMPPYRGPQHE